ncbi:HpcH/HpaI aldolase/citrate lyase family protein [Amycolatopsis sp. 195334CR]|uniref:HpcH/HpaI aldolase family protein n=1 Tax=Amycolatopsis sp. 195334CR TaxID=2814588 RepID=UPI001A8D8326|nr:aldolase/citrate lyase family protein [Amycolatopsis sp. 195334CR]MBN6038814.1 hypothetical protein [Amycolatopsis sp. 195334CR]
MTGLRDRLAGGGLLGTFNLLPSPEIVELIALAGFDVVIVDMEHGPHALGDVRRAVLAANAHGLHAVVRVPALDPWCVGAVLDVGASGVLVPQVASAAEAAAVVRAARFAPEGDRGANPYVRAAGFGHRENWYAAANAEVAVLVMVEGRAALAELDEILAVPGLDGVFLGPVDLSHSLGVPGRIGHPLVVEALERAVGRATASGVATGVFTPGAESVAGWWRLGVRLVACGVDTAVVATALTATVAAARA